MRVAIAGGGTGGHIYSGLAVCERLVDKSYGGNEVIFIGTKYGIEKDVLPRIGKRVFFLPVGKFRKSGLLAKAWSLLILPISVFASVWLPLKLRPDAALGVGGYASGPFILAASLLWLPTAIIVQNSIPGVTNRILGRWVKKAFLGIPGVESEFPDGVGEYVGNPIRRDLFEVPQLKEIRGIFTILIFGGSQGAGRINELIKDALPMLLNFRDKIKFIHITGSLHYRLMKEAYKKFNIKAEVFEFSDEMERHYARAHFVIARSGALTVSELCAVGRPSLLIPYPFAVDDHQAKNAEFLTKNGAAIMIRQEELTGDKISEIIISKMSNPEGLIEMGKMAKKLAKPDSAKKIAEWIINSNKRN